MSEKNKEAIPPSIPVDTHETTFSHVYIYHPFYYLGRWWVKIPDWDTGAGLYGTVNAEGLNERRMPVRWVMPSRTVYARPGDYKEANNE